ncbi:MAG: hypothetical protein EOP88_19065 [Verrucomicrobiaceae bacterium]|nr:MAG: hypothetical protein EOP88_19065 [Verrucomicrobiaceae bacterium]
MKTASPSMTACVVVLVSCLAWIGGLSLTLVHVLELTALTGWIIAGSLGFSAVAAVTAILFEMRHAVDLETFADPAEFENITVPAYWGRKVSAPEARRIPATSFQIRH